MKTLKQHRSIARFIAVYILGLLFVAISGRALATGTTYIYDPSGRLIQKVAPDGSSEQLVYNSNGQLIATKPLAQSTLATTGASANSGTLGGTITIYGSGFSTTPGDNHVYLNGELVTVIASTANSITFIIPGDASSGAVTITDANGTVTASSNFTVAASSPLPNITGISPQIGVAGDTLTLHGTNFQPVPVENSVYFHGGIPASISAATSTSLSVTVPVGYPSGKITVQTAFGTTVSGQDFYAAPTGHTASDIGAALRISTNNEPLAVTLASPQTIGMVLFDGAAGQHLSLKVSAPNFPSLCNFGSIKIYGPSPGNQTLVETNFCEGFSFVTLPAAGTYTIVVVPNSSDTGSLTLNLGIVPPDNVSSVAADGQANTATFATPGQGQDFTFSGTAGQRISVVTSNNTLPEAFSGIVLTPDGNVLATLSGAGNVFFGPYELPDTGTYTIKLTPQHGDTGAITIQIYNVPPDVGGAVTTDGTSQTMSISAPGQAASYTFSGTAGQRIGILTSSDTLNQWYSGSVRGPDGSTLATFTGFSGNFFGPYTLPLSGTYTVQIVPQSGGTGALTLQFYNVPADVSASASADGTSSAINIGTPGQGAVLTFGSSAGAKLSLVTSGVTFNQAYDGTLLNPDGTVAATLWGIGNRFFGTYPVTQTGVYTLKLVPEGGGTGSITVQVFTLPADTTGTLTSNGTPTAVNVGTPGQGATLTFNGTTGQSITLGTSGNSFTNFIDIVVLDPSGNAVASFSALGTGSHGPYTLSQTGQFTVTIKPEGGATGSVFIQLGSVATDISGTITADGTPVVMGITSPGQKASYTFNGNAGQRISLVTSNDSLSNWYDITLVNPDGTTWPTIFGFSGHGFGPYALSQTGIYTLKVVPESNGTGSLTMQLYNIPPNVTGALPTDGTSTALTVSVPGQAATYTFSESSGTCFSMVLSGSTMNNWIDFTIVNPDGSTLLTFSSFGGYSGPHCVTQTGTYTLQMVPELDASGSVNLQLYTIPPDAAASPAIGGSSVTVAISTPGEGATLHFSGVANQNVSIQVSNNTISNWYDGTLYNPDGSVLATLSTFGTYASGPYSMTQTGTYTLRLLPEQGATGSITLALVGS